jgi:hypothetical protein
MAIKQISAYPTITPGEYDERTGRYENVGIDDTGWNWDENTGKTTKIDPNFQAPSQFTLEDIKNRSGYAFDPNQDKLVTDSADASLDPSAYYNQLAKDLSEASYGIWSTNGDPSQYTDLIESLKEVDPKAYYTAKIDTLSRGVGHQYQSNQGARGDVVKQQLQDLIPEAQKAGLTPQEISSLYGSGYSAGAQGFSQILQNQQSQGGPYTPLWEGIKFVGPGLLGMYGIDSALTAGLGAAYGAGTGMSTVGLGSGIGGAAALEGGALAAGAGSLGSGALGAGAIASEAGQAAFFEALANGATSTEALNAGLGIESLASGTASYMTPELMGPTYGELGITGVEGGFAGPTYAEMGYTGLNQGQAIAAADAAAKGMSASEILSNANRVRTGANTLAKLLGGGNTTAGKTGIGTTAGTTSGTGANTQQLASLLALPTQAAPGGLYRMNENPFNFGTQGQTVANTNMYDVSGTNPMANQLRKKNYGIG